MTDNIFNEKWNWMMTIQIFRLFMAINAFVGSNNDFGYINRRWQLKWRSAINLVLQWLPLINRYGYDDDSNGGSTHTSFTPLLRNHPPRRAQSRPHLRLKADFVFKVLPLMNQMNISKYRPVNAISVASMNIWLVKMVTIGLMSILFA